MEQIYKQLKESVDFIKSKIDFVPKIAIVLGTGLGSLAEEIEIEYSLDYSEVPNFPLSTVEAHSGKLLFGYMSGRQIVAMQGRFHFYEGYTMKQITLPVRVMAMLGAKTLIISNVCGSMNPLIGKKSVVAINDHINLLPGNPLIDVNDKRLGPRFVDMSEPYSKRLIGIAEDIALSKGIKLNHGIYAALSGPSLETRAEYRFLRIIGADLVGMSTVPENIVARQMNMEVLGLSIVTDECYPEALKPVKIEEIIANAAEGESKLTSIIKGVVERL
jgi:purine-nucleoside phosphorylase